MHKGVAKKEIVIHKLLVSQRRAVVKGEAAKRVIRKSRLDQPPKALSHENKQKGGKGITLVNAP